MNWRRVRGDESYPRFHVLEARFKQAWQSFLQFVDDEALGDVVVNQCELGYTNHIEKGAGWRELGELDGVFSVLRPRDAQSVLPIPETFSWNARYNLPDKRGRLHIEMNPVFRGRDMQVLLNLNLTARGAPASGSVEQILEWFRVAHEWCVGAFLAHTSAKAHELWGRQA
jgi:hypothetical protein